MNRVLYYRVFSRGGAMLAETYSAFVAGAWVSQGFPVQEICEKERSSAWHDESKGAEKGRESGGKIPQSFATAY